LNVNKGKDITFYTAAQAATVAVAALLCHRHSMRTTCRPYRL